MKIWVDVCNSPQATMIAAFYDKWLTDGHDVFVTSRPHANTEQILGQLNVPFRSVGSHYGSGTINKIFGFFWRCIKLCKVIAAEDCQVGFAQSSFYLPFVCRLLGMRSVYTNDNEHARGNLVAKLFASVCIFPSCWEKAYCREFVATHKYYMAIKEAIYFKDTQVPRRPAKIFYRPEAWDAQYYGATKPEVIVAMVQRLLVVAEVLVLCRSVEQVEFFESLNLAGLEASNEPVRREDILQDAVALVCSGGSMAREFALTNVPTISVYSHERLAVDRKLEKLGLLRMLKPENLTMDTLAEVADEKSAREALISDGKKDFLAMYREVLL